MAGIVSYDEVERLALSLSAIDKLRLIERLAAALRQELTEENGKPLPTPHEKPSLHHETNPEDL